MVRSFFTGALEGLITMTASDVTMFLLEVTFCLCYSLEFLRALLLQVAVGDFATQNVHRHVMVSGILNGGKLFYATQALDCSIWALKNVFIHLLFDFLI